MAKITQWEDSLSYRSDEELIKIDQALNTLKTWELFEQEYKEMIQLRTIVSEEVIKRLMASAPTLM